METAEARALVAQLTIRVWEELQEVFTPAGVTLPMLTDAYESHFDDIWPSSDQQTNQTPTEYPTETDSQITTTSIPATPHPPVTGNKPFSNKPRPTAFTRCGAATLAGTRCQRALMVPHTVCDIHVNYFRRHGHLPVGGALTPESNHPDDVDLNNRPRGQNCTCHVVRHVCAACRPQLG